uniref:GIY-YIG endonuclease n=1 Tax=Cryphonectria parasitica TaxID=5116 RepID=A0A191MX83_CRYPA|nr:GIY-YIG endonuclease [Cryphonectria parasitica]
MGGVYFIHNIVKGKEYVCSGFNSSKILSTYYFSSCLADGRFISNSILKYGHENFSAQPVILVVLGDSQTDACTKTVIIDKEEEYICLYKPILNLNPALGSSVGFKHSE